MTTAAATTTQIRYTNTSESWGDAVEVTPADYEAQAKSFGVEVIVTADDAGIYVDGDLVAEPIVAAADRLKELQDWEDFNDFRTEDLIMEWANCTEVEISEGGSVWIASQGHGEWLSDDGLAEFIAWERARA